MDYKTIISKKERNEILSCEELNYIFNGYLKGEVTDEEMTVLLKAICRFSLSIDETFALTDIFIKSGETIDLSNLGVVVDKHSTGGVGDKLTLIVGPIVASLGIKMVKMSGRGLGHTGGTIDKLESIEGLKVNLSKQEFIEQINRINIAITSQTDNIVPLDKKVYALRDITGTTMSLPLIASSIMSKKIACGANKILLDIKIGNGALIPTLEEAKKLASIMIAIGKKYNRETVCMLTDMSSPLGDYIGNGLEVVEAIDVLNNRGNDRLKRLAIHMSSLLVCMARKTTINVATNLVNDVLQKGLAFNKFNELVSYQGGKIKNITISSNKIGVYANKSGIITSINALEIGKFVGSLGASRKTKDDQIDYGVGVILNKRVGDTIENKELLCTVFYNKEFNKEQILNCFSINDTRIEEIPLVYEIIK